MYNITTFIRKLLVEVERQIYSKFTNQFNMKSDNSLIPVAT